MDTKEIANRLVGLCREGKYLDAIDELYDQNIVSVEPEYARTPLTNGFENVRKKSEEWAASIIEIHSTETSDPIIAGNFFSCVMKVDATMKEMGRFVMEEICVYEVRNGKIVFEQFFYPNMMG